MTDFVEQCRVAWKRLGVPDPVAEEMAEDLASDLGEAEADGVSAEELLGSSVLDPSSFAASWAAERGIIPAAAGRGSTRHRPIVLVAFTAVAAITVIISALMLATGEPKLSLVRSRATPAGQSRSVVHAVSPAAPVEWILLLLGILALGFAVWLWAGSRRSRLPAATVEA
jgi:hypothetical protein